MGILQWRESREGIDFPWFVGKAKTERTVLPKASVRRGNDEPHKSLLYSRLIDLYSQQYDKLATRSSS